ncbi:TPA: hypothetical protein ACF67X_004962 [Salmonella enterica]
MVEAAPVVGLCQNHVIRVDLHLPEDGDVGDSIVGDADLSQGLMSRFIDSLKA